MEDILQMLQTSWPILLMVVIFFSYYGVHKKTTKRAR